MANMLADGVGWMVERHLAANGVEVTYLRDGIEAGTLTMSKQNQPSQYLDNGQGGFLEVAPVDFVAKTSELLFNPPLRGDQISVGGELFEVLPTIGEKVTRVISSPMTRIHTKQVATA